MPATQAFLIFDKAGGSRRRHVPDGLSGALKSERQVEARPAFYFRNGRVFLVSPKATPSKPAARMATRFPRRGQHAFHELAFDDGVYDAGWLYFGEDRP
jgi:hypothetical protein